MLVVHDVGVDAIRKLKPLVARIRSFDRDLADQLVRAASSVVLNIAEGAHSRGGNKRLRYASAQGSASEARSALLVAVAWGYVASDEARTATALLDRVIGMLWPLTRERARPL